MNADSKRAIRAVSLTLALLAPWTPVRASRPVNEQHAADPQGDVEIVNVAGTVDVEGWDRDEVVVGGTTGDAVDRVELTSSGKHTSIHVISHSVHVWGSSGEARLTVHVPSGSSVSTSLVSADLKITGVKGDSKLRTISGDVKGEVGGDVRATTVSGEIRLSAPSAKSIELETTSGDINFKGGGGDVDVSTVSGTASMTLSDLTRGRFKSISGDVSVQLGMKAAAEIEGESVSGDLTFKFSAVPDGEFDVQTLSGDIENCFGPKPRQPEYGPGSRLQFSSGQGRGRVNISTKSGDVKLCAPGAHGGSARSSGGAPPRDRAALLRPALDADQRRGPAHEASRTRLAMVVPYVF